MRESLVLIYISPSLNDFENLFRCLLDILICVPGHSLCSFFKLVSFWYLKIYSVYLSFVIYIFLLYSYLLFTNVLFHFEAYLLILWYLVQKFF